MNESKSDKGLSIYLCVYVLMYTLDTSVNQLKSVAT